MLATRDSPCPNPVFAIPFLIDLQTSSLVLPPSPSPSAHSAPPWQHATTRPWGSPDLSSLCPNPVFTAPFAHPTPGPTLAARHHACGHGRGEALRAPHVQVHHQLVALAALELAQLGGGQEGAERKDITYAS